MKSKNWSMCFLFVTVLLLWSCEQEKSTTQHSISLIEQLSSLASIAGSSAYLGSPSLTAGDRVYAVGHQDGTFPDLGWHVEGEMGGIWNHPIKLMDGFTAQVSSGGESICLETADTFQTYPVGTLRTYKLANGLTVERFQFVPDQQQGMVVEYRFTNNSDKKFEGNFTFSGLSDLRPVWLAEKLNIKDGEDEVQFNTTLEAFVAKDKQNPWLALWGSASQAQSSTTEAVCDSPRKGMGKAGTLSYALDIPKNEYYAIQMVIAGSYISEENAQQTFKTILAEAPQFLAKKIERYAEIKNQSKLTIPNKKIQQAFEWVKYNTDWLIRDVPEVGRGLSAGIPDYPWWFGCDNTYALQGVLATGNHKLAKETLQLIHKLSTETNTNGRIIHEASTNGVVFNEGNSNETPHFAYMLWDYYEWTGDQAFLETCYPTVKRGLKWLLEERDEDGNLNPEGAGMMEIHGLDSEMIDVAVYTQQGFEAAAKMAILFSESDVAQHYTKIADQLKEQINTKWWVEADSSYADFIATKPKTLELIEGAIIRADTLNKPWAVEELEEKKAWVEQLGNEEAQGFVVHHNWVVNTPMEMGIADKEKALKALETGSKFINPFGVFVTGIDRDESAGTDDSSFAKDKEIFSYVGAVMTLPTGVQAIAESNYGRQDKALDYLNRMTNSFSYAFPGGMYEVSPDFGMMVQAWNIYALAKPIVENFFGIQPQAGKKQIVITPQFPSAWKEASLENVKVGENTISLFKKEVEGSIEYTIQQLNKEWEIQLNLPENSSVKVNGETIQTTAANSFKTIIIKGKQNVVKVN